MRELPTTPAPKCTSAVTVGYALRHSVTGELARVQSAGGVCWFYLVPGGLDAMLPLFTVDSYDKAALVKATRTPRDRSRAESPCWTDDNLDAYEVVRIVTTVLVEAVTA